MGLKEIEERLTAIRNDIETRGAQLTAEQITAYETEVRELQKKRTQELERIEQRNNLLQQLAAGGEVHNPDGTITQPTVLRSIKPADGSISANNTRRENRGDNPTDSVEYRTAFMNYVCRNEEMPKELRTSETTTVADTGAVIPNTIMKEIITKLDSYGNLYAGFTKINTKGGVAIPIGDLKPVARWVGEGSGEDQKLSSKKSITFNYYGLEVKLSQSILANAVTLDMFQQLFIPLATEAMVKAIELASIKGTGEEGGQILGVTVDERVKNVVTLSEEEIATWSGWHKKVKSKIKKAYRNGVLIMNQSTFETYIDGMVDTNGQPVGRTNYGINGEETYRFMGKNVETVDDDLIASFDDAETDEVIGVFMKLSDFVINSNMEMKVTKWTDHDNNKIKNKVMMIIDGKIADADGVIIIKKGIKAV